MQKRRYLAAACGAFALAVQIVMAAPTTTSQKSSRFYGNITNVNTSQGELTVHNKKNKSDATFKITSETHITKNKVEISPKELEVGQSLVVYYVSENDIARARRISVRTQKQKSE